MDTTLSEQDDIDQIPPDVYRRRWVILGVLCTSLLIIVIGNTKNGLPLVMGQ